MTRWKKVSPEGHSKPVASYSPGIVVSVAACSGLIFISGQVSTDAEGQVVGRGDPGRQTEVVFERLRAVLAEAGASIEDVVSVTIYVVDLSSNFARVSAVRDLILGNTSPSSTLVGVAALVEEGCLVELSAIAAVRG